MFLHSGAAFHGHEFSQKRPPSDVTLQSNHLPRRIPLARSAFSSPITQIYENPLPIITPPLRPFSEEIQRNTEPVVRFREPDLETMSDDGRSLANSEGSEVTAGGRRRRRPIRTSTAFSLAHPAPTLTQKQRLLQIRPKLLLQLQRLSADSRPMPAIDVLPSTVVVPRLAKKFPRILRGKGELGCNDVMVVKSEEYHTPPENLMDESDSDEDGLANRDLVAVICQMRKDLGGASGKAEIVLSDGSVWSATPLPNGLFEFVTVNDQGHNITARWVRRSIKRGSVDITESNSSTDLKFTFSIIDPESRRHPILATLTQNKLDIPDFYMSVSKSAGKFPPTSQIRGFAGDSHEVVYEEPQRATQAVDDSTKTLIQVTAIWLALRLGWSPYFKYSDTMTPHTTPGNRVRSLSLTADQSRLSPVPTCASTPESTNSTLGAISNRIRRVSAKGSPISSESPQPERIIPQRSMSAGTAFMQRATARRMGNPPSTVASDSEGEGIDLHRSTTEKIIPLNRMSNPRIPLTFDGSAATVTTPDTPTRPQRRGKSAYIPPSALQASNVIKQPQRHSIAIGTMKQTSDISVKPKASRWKAFTNLFRRSSRSN